MIKKLEISGYRLLNQFTADFGDLTVVIGANATGKSTLLDCLQLIAQSAEFPSLNDVLSWHGGLPFICSAFAPGSRVEWRLTFTKPSRPPLWSAIPLEEGREFTYEVTLGQGAYGLPKLVHEALRLPKPRDGYDEPFKYLESTASRSKVYDFRQRRLVDDFDAIPVSATRGPHVGDEEPQRQIPANSQLTAASEGPSLLLPRMRFFNEYPQPSYVRALLANVALYPGFDVGKSSVLRGKPADVKPETFLYPSGENLGTVLHEILTRHDFRENAEQMHDFLKAAYPFFEDINAETAYGAPGKVVVRWREKGMQRPMEMWDLSDGVLRFLCLAAALLNPMPPPLIAMDEPEAGLHPRLLPIVADMIKTAAENTQVLVTTHSPDLLSRFSLDDIAVMTRNESGAAWGRPGSRGSLRKMLEAVGGDTLGDLHRSGELEAMG